MDASVQVLKESPTPYWSGVFYFAVLLSLFMALIKLTACTFRTLLSMRFGLFRYKRI